MSARREIAVVKRHGEAGGGRIRIGGICRPHIIPPTAARNISIGLDQRFFIRCLNDATKIQLGANQEFEIDWEGEFQREVYQKRLPEFPPDVQREAIIKIQFSVLPSGLVGSAVLLQKGDTRLENITLEAFKTWRFSPLPGYVEQVNQSGVITFRFKLK